MPDHIEDKRAFERHPLELEVDISTFSGTEKHLVERVTLKDISGSGACFISSQPGVYAIGQKISMDICLPGTCEADVRMEGHATVVWIGDTETREAGKPSQMLAGVSMDKPLSFQQGPRDTDSGEEEPGGAS